MMQLKSKGGRAVDDAVGFAGCAGAFRAGHFTDVFTLR